MKDRTSDLFGQSDREVLNPPLFEIGDGVRSLQWRRWLLKLLVLGGILGSAWLVYIKKHDQVQDRRFGHEPKPAQSVVQRFQPMP